MDMFMDKLAQKLTAQEIIRANTAADTEELNQLRSRVKEYNECLDKLQKLIDEGAAKLSSAQSVNGNEINRIVETSVGAAVAKKLESINQALAEQTGSVDKSVSEQMSRIDKSVSEQLAEIDRKLEARLEQLSEKLQADSTGKLPERLDEMDENVHKECVKVYRNVQAVVVEESGKQKESLEAAASGVKALEGKLGVVFGVSVAALVISLISLIIQILGILPINLF